MYRKLFLFGHVIKDVLKEYLGLKASGRLFTLQVCFFSTSSVNLYKISPDNKQKQFMQKCG